MPRAGLRLTNAPLALDLHYLLSVYSSGDLHAEILLGYAMQLLHEMPVLTRDAIRTALNPSPDVGTSLPPALRALVDSGLEDQVELIKLDAAVLQHRGDVEALDRDAEPLPADRRLHRVGRADRGAGGPHARRCRC